MMVRNRSCPAVSHICSFTHLFSSRIFFILKSMLHAPRTLSSQSSAPRTTRNIAKALGGRRTRSSL